MADRKVCEFDAGIRQSDEKGAGAFLPFPYDPRGVLREAQYGQGSMHLRRRYVPRLMGSGPCIGILKEIREQIGKGRGDTVHVVLQRDEEERAIEVPEDLAAALGMSVAARALFETL